MVSITKLIVVSGICFFVMACMPYRGIKLGRDDIFKSRNSRYEDDSRRITVSAGKPPEPVAPALPEVIPADIDLSASLPEIADVVDFPITTVNPQEDIIVDTETQSQS